MLATKVIATGITHLTDARYFAAWEVDVLAFRLGKGGVDWLALNAMREWIEGPQIAVEISGADAGAVIGEVKGNDIHLAITPHTTPVSLLEELKAAGVQTLLSLPVAGYQSAEDIHELLQDYPLADGFLLDFESQGITWADLGEGHPFSPTDLNQLLSSRPVYLQIAIREADPKAIARQHPIAGFAVRGSGEEKVGYKSFDDLDPLFEGLEVFD